MSGWKKINNTKKKCPGGAATLPGPALKPGSGHQRSGIKPGLSKAILILSNFGEKNMKKKDKKRKVSTYEAACVEAANVDLGSAMLNNEILEKFIRMIIDYPPLAWRIVMPFLEKEGYRLIPEDECPTVEELKRIYPGIEAES